MPEYVYQIDGIRHTIRPSNPFPPSVRRNDAGEIHIPPKQQQICRNLKRLLVAWKRIAAELDIAWFLNGGSLLGTLRDQGLIFYDNDIDLVVQMKDYHKLLHYNCPDGLFLTPSEAGFNFSRTTNRFPFIDIWVIGPDLTDASKMRICGPILSDGRPSYYYTNVWPNEWYYNDEVCNRSKARFEGIRVFLPSNAEAIVKRMYGPNCLVEYRMESHVDNHALSNLFDIEPRMKLAQSVQRVNQLLGLDRTRQPNGHLSGLMCKMITELLFVSSSQKPARIQNYLHEYLKVNLIDEPLVRV